MLALQDGGRGGGTGISTSGGEKLRWGRAVVVLLPHCKSAVEPRLTAHFLTPTNQYRFGLNSFGRSPIRIVPGFKAGLFGQN